ncbi:MAG: 3-phosphoshikimate 1-carboxyvinyltransferase [Bacteroidales bacterium]|nr:3-phosphoshikimate 1-carboxyvinyltransferase [Bacteroidales bacterium]
MDVIISPSIINGDINAPPSKSSMLRAVAAGLLADGTTVISNPSFCEDSVAAMRVAECLGAGVENDQGNVIIKGGLNPVCNELDCGESGLGVRMFTPIAALGNSKLKITGRGSLLSRPMDMISNSLIQLGVDISLNKGSLPIAVKGPLRGGLAYIDGSVSSQLITGLLMALPLADNDSRLIIKSITSRSYIDLTIDILNNFGIEIINRSYSEFFIPSGQLYRPATFHVEGDWSGAAFFVVLGAVAGRVNIHGISTASMQPDRRIIEVVKMAGATVNESDREITIIPGELKSFDFDIGESPDLAPPVAILAALCNGKSFIRGTSRLKVKESDRGEALTKELSALGVKIINNNDHIIIEGSASFKGGIVSSHGDHRIAMAMGIAGLVADDTITIKDGEVVNKSFPGFYDELTRLGAHVEFVN